MNRREFLRASGGLAALSTGAGLTLAAEAGSPVSPWRKGYLDIHHINTGRGNSALVIMPDGTSLLVDAGAAGTQGAAMNAARPDTSRRPGEWIARYAQRRLKEASSGGLDYALLTHFHGDHVGDVTAQSPRSPDGSYRLTGISDVAEALPIGKIIDRGFPEYNDPAPAADPAAKNYIEFARSAARGKTIVERAQAGSRNQIVPLKSSSLLTDFGVRVIACNGNVWTGKGEAALPHFPSQADADHLANENSCSIALRIGYGRFGYFTGGDLDCDTHYGRDPWRDIETPAARAAGPVSVATCNHHGYFDACGPEFVRGLAPRVWILQSWHASHPALSTLANLLSSVLYPGPRDVFCLSLHPAAALTCGRFSDKFKSSQGHVLVRVSPGGAEYSVLVLEDGDQSDRVKAVFGPYPS